MAIMRDKFNSVFLSLLQVLLLPPPPWLSPLRLPARFSVSFSCEVAGEKIQRRNSRMRAVKLSRVGGIVVGGHIYSLTPILHP